MPDVVHSLTIKWAQASTTTGPFIRCVLHARSATDLTDADRTLLADRVKDWWSNTGIPNYGKLSWNAQTLLTDVVVKRVLPTPSLGFAATPFAPVAGGDAVNTVVLPPQCSICITLRSATMSRRSRGRMYLPAPPAQVTRVAADGSIVAAFRDQYANTIRKLRDHINSYGGSVAVSMAIFSRTNQLAYDVLTTPAGVTCGPIIDVQRRRKLTEYPQ